MTDVPIGTLAGRPRTAVVVGNPRAGSRTLASALHLARELTGDPELVLDLAVLGGAVLDLRDERVPRLVEEVASYDVVVVASPTYKASVTGLLKAFLDRFPPAGLRGVVAVPLMLGAGPAHALAVETSLRPVLTELGATVPVGGLYVLDAAHADPTAYTHWLESARPVVHALAGRRTPTPGAVS
jgi:FMN reductase